MHTLCFRGAPPAAEAAAAPSLWSRPLTVRYPEEEVLHLLVPVSVGQHLGQDLGQAQQGERGGSGGGAGSATAQPQQAQAASGGSSGTPGSGPGRRDSAHLTASAAGAAGPAQQGAQAVAVLRLRVSQRGMGALQVGMHAALHYAVLYWEPPHADWYACAMPVCTLPVCTLH